MPTSSAASPPNWTCPNVDPGSAYEDVDEDILQVCLAFGASEVRGGALQFVMCSGVLRHPSSDFGIISF